MVTKRFAVLRAELGITRPGLVFHSTRKWFVTQCEREGVVCVIEAGLSAHIGRAKIKAEGVEE